MNNNEILKKASHKKAYVGEMEKERINKSCWIGNVVAVVLAVAFMIAEGAFSRFSSVYALGVVCYAWASVFYFCQFFIAKRPWQVLIGAVLHGTAALVMMTFYILTAWGII